MGRGSYSYLSHPRVVIGDRGTCPDCLLLMVSPMTRTGTTLQSTVQREPKEEGWELWNRAIKEAEDIARQMVGKPLIAIFCKYGVTYNPKARENDYRENYLRVLLTRMEEDPSHVARVQAACQAADMLWAPSQAKEISLQESRLH